jgi:hypothetical protein
MFMVLGATDEYQSMVDLDRPFAIFLWVIFAVVVVVILFNIFLAIILDAYADVNDETAKEQVVGRINI